MLDFTPPLPSPPEAQNIKMVFFGFVLIKTSLTEELISEVSISS